MATAKYAMDGAGTKRGQFVDVVEAALAEALAGAARAERWDVVVLMAKELEARRLHRT